MMSLEVHMKPNVSAPQRKAPKQRPIGPLPDRIVSIADTSAMVNMSRTSLWRREKAGTFPRRVRTGERGCGYKLSELLAWLESLERGPGRFEPSRGTDATAQR